MDGQSIEEFEAISRTTSTSSGIACHRAVTCRRRCGGWTYRRAMGDAAVGYSDGGRSHCPDGGQTIFWSRWWNPCSIPTRMDTGPGDPRSMRSARRASDAGATTGSWILISRASSTASIGLLMRAVRKHTECRWVALYVERWLKAPAMEEDGTLVLREQGTPQGGVISPFWRTCSCITPSICGCSASIPTIRSSVMPTMVCHEGAGGNARCRTAREMRVGPSKPAVRSRLQTTTSRGGKEPVW